MLQSVEQMKKKGSLTKDVFKKLGLENVDESPRMENKNNADEINQMLNNDSIGHSNLLQDSAETFD